MKRFYFVILHNTEIGTSRDVVECSSLYEALNMLEMSENTWYDDPDISYHVEEHIIECPN